MKFYITKEGPWFVAQGHEIDLLTQAKTHADLIVNIDSIIRIHHQIAQDRGEKPFEGIGMGPKINMEDVLEIVEVDENVGI